MIFFFFLEQSGKAQVLFVIFISCVFSVFLRTTIPRDSFLPCFRGKRRCRCSGPTQGEAASAQTGT